MRRRFDLDDAIMAFAPLNFIPALLPVEGTTGGMRTTTSLWAVEIRPVEENL
jgi:hypothetical protein